MFGHEQNFLGENPKNRIYPLQWFQAAEGYRALSEFIFGQSGRNEIDSLGDSGLILFPLNFPFSISILSFRISLTSSLIWIGFSSFEQLISKI